MVVTSQTLRACLELAFGKPIREIRKAPARKKTDVLACFMDGSVSKLQLKNGNSVRGFHVHREPIEQFPVDVAQRQLFRSVCLKSGEPRVEAANSGMFVCRTILGTEPEWEPEFILHTTTDGTSIQICPVLSFMNRMLSTMYPTLVAKRTCIHINPYMYIQRRGGEKHDRRPDDLQMKVRLQQLLADPDLFTTFTAPSVVLV